MRAAIREIVEYVQRHPELTTKDAVDRYFAEIIWSLEKDEYQRMSLEERQRFIEAIDRAANKPR